MGDYELYHASTRKHKYIKKIGNRYFYSQAEIQAYYDGKTPSDSESKKTSSRYQAPKYAVNDGGYSVSRIAKSAAEDAVKKDARAKARHAVSTTTFVANENKRSIAKSEEKKTKRRKKASTLTSKHLSKSVKSFKKQASKGKRFLKELVAPPKIGHETTIKTGGSTTVKHT